MTDFAVETIGLSKTFTKRTGWHNLRKLPHTTAVESVSFAVEKGELFGLLGPNGAGKTTLIKILCTLIRPSSGSAKILGHDLDDQSAIRTNIGLAVTDERSFFWRLTARRNLHFYAAMHNIYGADGRKRSDEVLEAVNLTEKGEVRFSELSSGMRQRMAIARALLHRPKVLFLDEPSRSLDPTSTLNLHQLVESLIEQRGMTVVWITHDLVEAEKLCDRIAVMHKGRIQAVGTSESLRRELQPYRHYRVRLGSVSAELLTAISPYVTNLSQDGTSIQFDAHEDDDSFNNVLDCIHQHGLTVKAIDGQAASMEEVFARITNV